MTEKRPYAYSGGKKISTKRHIISAPEIVDLFVRVGWIGRCRSRPSVVRVPHLDIGLAESRQ